MRFHARLGLAWGVLLAVVLIGTPPLFSEGSKESGGDLKKTYAATYVHQASLKVKSITVTATLQPGASNQWIALGEATGSVKGLPSEFKNPQVIAVIQVFEFPDAVMKDSVVTTGKSQERTSFDGALEVWVKSTGDLPTLLLVVPAWQGKAMVVLQLPADQKTQMIKQDGFELQYERSSASEVHLTIKSWPPGHPIIISV